MPCQLGNCKLLMLSYYKENQKANFRIVEAKANQEKIVDVDGSYLYLKRKIISSGVSITPVSHPPSPLIGWETVNAENYKEYSSKIPIVTPGCYITINFIAVEDHLFHLLAMFMCTWQRVLVPHNNKGHFEHCPEDMYIGNQGV